MGRERKGREKREEKKKIFHRELNPGPLIGRSKL